MKLSPNLFRKVNKIMLSWEVFILEVNNKNRKKSEVIWGMFGLAFGVGVGAILGIIVYNNQWLG